LRRFGFFLALGEGAGPQQPVRLKLVLTSARVASRDFSSSLPSRSRLNSQELLQRGKIQISAHAADFAMHLSSKPRAAGAFQTAWRSRVKQAA